MPKSKAAKQRQRINQDTNSTFVAQQLKQHLFGNENVNDSGDDLSGDEKINNNHDYFDEDSTATVVPGTRDYRPATNKAKTQAISTAHVGSTTNNNVATILPNSGSGVPPSASNVAGRIGDSLLPLDNNNEDDDDVIYDEDEAALRRKGTTANKMVTDNEYGIGGGGGAGGGGAAKGGGKNALVGASAADAASGAGGTVVGSRSREKDQSERATVETVMDPRTRLILHKMVNSGILDRVHGCVSTGKEANVYLGILGEAGQGIWENSQQQILQIQEQLKKQQESSSAPLTKKQQAKQNHFHPQQYTANKKKNNSGGNNKSKNQQQQQQKQNENNDVPELVSTAAAEQQQDNNNNKLDIGDHPFKPGAFIALKIYKTSILVFKDREKYVAGEHRFQRYCKSNPRKMVRTWAEKESRNLNRLYNGGVPCPRVFLLRQHILAMEFLGSEGWPAPRLKDVRLSPSAFEKCYHQVCVGMRKMFQDCRLVHGDLSEFNLLVCNGKVMFIDVSQSVEHDHPQSLDFLRRDIVNVHVFFKSKGVTSCMPHRELFEFITATENKPWCGQSGEAEEWLKSQKEVWRDNNENAIKDNEEGVDQRKEDELFLEVPIPRDLKGDAVSKSLANPDIAPLMRAMLGVEGMNDDDDDDDYSSDEDEEEEEESDDEEETEKKSKTRRKANDRDDDEEEEGDDSAESGDDANEEDQDTPLGRYDAWCKTDDTLKAATSELLSRVRKLLVEHANGQATLAMMSKEEKKLFQHAIKLEQRKKRTEKVPKHLKKRATKKHMKK